MPNNGVISKYANIPSSFIVESAQDTDLVIINTPLSGSKVEQKAVPVSALGGGSPATLPFNSFVFAIQLSGTVDNSFEIYNDFPSSLGYFSVSVFTGLTPLDIVNVQVNWIGDSIVDLRTCFFSLESSIVLSSSTMLKNGSNIAFSISDATVLQTPSLFELRVYNLNP
jgi:hypothetical protein